MFEISVSTLLNGKSGVLVIDDELVSFCADDVKFKTLSNIKSGKEGPVADFLACSFTSVRYVLCIRV